MFVKCLQHPVCFFLQMETVSKQYEELYYKNKDFDARLFLVDDETLSPNKTETYV